MKRLLALIFLFTGVAQAQKIIPVVSGTATIDFAQVGGPSFKVFVTSDLTLTITNQPQGNPNIITVLFSQDAVGHSVTFDPTVFKSVATIPTTPSSQTSASFQFDGNSNFWYGISAVPVGSGFVSSVSCQNLTPLFTCFVNNATTTPDINFVLSNAAANTVLGNFTSGSAAPTYGSINVAMLPVNIPNANLQFSSTTVNGQTCTLGASCSITVPGGGTAGDQFSPQYSSDGAGGHAGVAPPTVNGQYDCGFNITGSAAVAPTCPQLGVTNVSISGATTTFTFTYAHNAEIITHDSAASGTVGATLPTATTLLNANYITSYCNASAQTDVITPTTWTIKGSATLNVPQGLCYRIHPDPTTVTNWLADPSGMPSAGPGSGTVTSAVIAGTSNQITASGTCTITTTGTCTLSLPNGVQLGTDNSAAGTLQLANSAANAHTIWGSGATTTNTIQGFAAVPTTGHLLDCTVTSTTCLLHDSGIATANVLLGASLGAGVVHAPGSSQTMTSSAVVSADLSITTTACTNQVVSAISSAAAGTCHTVVGGDMASATVTATQLAAQYSKGSCTELWGGSGTSFALTSGDDAISNNSCYNDSGVTRTITAVKCRSDNGSNTTTVNPTFGASGTGTTILSGALTCGSSLAYSSTGTVSNASWTTGTGITPAMSGTLTGTSIAMIVEYTF